MLGSFKACSNCGSSDFKRLVMNRAIQCTRCHMILEERHHGDLLENYALTQTERPHCVVTPDFLHTHIYDDIPDDPYCTPGFITAFRMLSPLHDPVYTSTARTLSGALCDMERVVGDALYGDYVGYNGRGPGIGGSGSKGDGRHTLLAYFEILELAGLLGVDRETSILAVRIFRYTAACTSLRNRSVESLATAAFVAALERRRYEYNEWKKTRVECKERELKAEVDAQDLANGEGDQQRDNANGSCNGDGGNQKLGEREADDEDWRHKPPPPLTLLEIAEAAQLDEKEVRRALRVVNNALQRQRPENSASVSTHMPEFCRRLNLPQSVQDLAQSIAQKALEHDICARRNPISISAAAIYLACQVRGIRKTQTEICKVTALTEVTLRKVYKELAANTDRLLPPNCEGFISLKESQPQQRDKSMGTSATETPVKSEALGKAPSGKSKGSTPSQHNLPLPKDNAQEHPTASPTLSFPPMSGQQMQQQFQRMMQMIMQGAASNLYAMQNSAGSDQTAPRTTPASFQLPPQFVSMLPPPPPLPPVLPIPLMSENSRKGVDESSQLDSEPKAPVGPIQSQVADSGSDGLEGEINLKVDGNLSPDTPSSQVDPKPFQMTEVSQKPMESQVDSVPTFGSQVEPPLATGAKTSLLKTQTKITKELTKQKPNDAENPKKPNASSGSASPAHTGPTQVPVPKTDPPQVKSEIPQQQVQQLMKQMQLQQQEIVKLKEMLARTQQSQLGSTDNGVTSSVTAPSTKSPAPPTVSQIPPNPALMMSMLNPMMLQAMTSGSAVSSCILNPSQNMPSTAKGNMPGPLNGLNFKDNECEEKKEKETSKEEKTGGEGKKDEGGIQDLAKEMK